MQVTFARQLTIIEENGMQHLHVDAINADGCLVYSSGQAVPID